MALVVCKECAKPVSSEASRCPHCGIDRPASVPVRPTSRVAIAVVVLGVLIVASAIGTSEGSPPLGAGSSTVGAERGAAQPAGSGIEVRPQQPTAVRRVRLAEELQGLFAGSALENMEIRFAARGDKCDILHVEAFNMYVEMMEALAYGTVMYGRILPGGVNARAQQEGFRNIVYTNRADNVTRAFGPSKLSATRMARARSCDEALASAVTEPAEAAAASLSGPAREALSWGNARPGLKLYDGSLVHVVTVVATDRANDIIEVQYVDGPRERKLLSAVADAWYVLK